jgi:hypothetical protein
MSTKSGTPSPVLISIVMLYHRICEQPLCNSLSLSLFPQKVNAKTSSNMRFRLLHKHFIIAVTCLICSITIIVNIVIVSLLVTLNSSSSDVMIQNFPRPFLQNNKTMKSRLRYPNVHIFYYPWYANPQTDSAWNHWNHKILPHWFERLSTMLFFFSQHNDHSFKFLDYVFCQE